ncbi:hypothetical protein BGX30_002902 [Mortierella sp. GBA39]|nr:hypothetical protein BGX30_002902 [Mortierella sp. GBA39]
MSARNFRTVSNFIPIQAGGGDGNGFLSPTIYYIENPLSGDIQKTEGAANLNMDDAIGLQRGPMSVLGTDDPVDDAANGGADAAADAVDDAADDVGPSSSFSCLSTSPTVNQVETTDDNANDGGADVEIEEEVVEEEVVEEEGGEEQEEAQDPLG